MTVSEQILTAFARHFNAKKTGAVLDHASSLEGALSLLQEEIPDFPPLIHGKKVLDFGCGEGMQAAALASTTDCTVVGVDTNPIALQKAIAFSEKNCIPADKLTFTNHVTDAMTNTFDVVISQNSFEHFPAPDDILSTMKGLINPSGRIIITFGPPWFAPYGNHMSFMSRIPWMNILFSEKTVMKVRSRYRTDGALRYEDIDWGLNKMTVAKFEQLIAESGLKILYRKYRCVKGLAFLSKVPSLRELFINHISVVLAKSA